MPALDVAGYDPLRWNVLTDLMKVEMERARSTRGGHRVALVIDRRSTA